MQADQKMRRERNLRDGDRIHCVPRSANGFAGASASHRCVSSTSPPQPSHGVRKQERKGEREGRREERKRKRKERKRKERKGKKKFHLTKIFTKFFTLQKLL